MELPATLTKQTISPPTRTMAAEALLLHATRVRGNKIASIDEDARRRVVTQSTPLNLKTEVASTCTPALTPDGPNAAPECKPGRTAPPELHIRSPSAYTAQHILVLQGPWWRTRSAPSTRIAQPELPIRSPSVCTAQHIPVFQGPCTRTPCVSIGSYANITSTICRSHTVNMKPGQRRGQLTTITGGKRAFGRGSQLPLVAVAQPRPN
jgi:hypothetical protein